MPLMTEIPENWREPAARMVTSLRGLDRVLVAAHVNPDGDALGSMSALGWLLKDMGKEFVLYSPSGVPDYLSFLPLPCTLLTSLERLPFEPQALVLLDCGEPHRLGDDLAAAVVDDNDAVFHLGDRIVVDQITGLVGQRAMQGNDIGLFV